MYKIAICDYDTKFVKQLRGLIEEHDKCPMDVSIDEYTTRKELVADIEKKHDIVFLDISLLRLEGIKIANLVRKLNRECIVVFCSNINDLTLDIFSVHPFSCVLKDYSNVQLSRELQDIFEELLLRRKTVPKFCIKQTGKNWIIGLDDIIYFSKLKRGSAVWIAENQKKENIPLEIKDTRSLAEIYEKVSPYGFEFAHSSYVVNFKHVSYVQREYLILSNHRRENISRSKRERFHLRWDEFLKKYSC